MMRFMRFLAFVAALALIGWGLATSTEQADRDWLLILLAAGVLLGIAWWPQGVRTLPSTNRTIVRTGMILLLVFTMLTVQLVRIQVVEGDNIVNRVATGPDDAVVSNLRLRIDELTHRRGRILDRHGVPMADSSQRDDGTWQRTWPESAAGSLVGYYSPALYGSTNLEAAFDDYLRGDKGGSKAQSWLDDLLHVEQGGYDVVTTIDLELQRLAVDLLDGRAGAVVLLDPATGEVLTMAGEPGLDPNLLYVNSGQQSAEEIDAAEAYWAQLLADPNSPLVFRPTSGLYNPGSTFKTLTATALIDSGQANPDTIFRDEGILEVDGRVIVENNRPDDTQVNWTLEESFAWSLNVVFAQIGLQLGPELLWEYAERFGFGDDIPFEIPTAASQVAEAETDLNTRTLLADTGFGQGHILASPLQMALLIAAVINDGVMPAPRIGSEVLDDDGDVLNRFDSDSLGRVMTPETAEQMQRLFEASVAYGYANGAAIDGATIGGKTGTAELDDGAAHSWFIGYAEAGERQWVVSVVVERGGAGSAAALPIGRALLEAAVGGS